VSGISGRLQGVGLPGALAYGVYVGEVLAPLLVIISFYSRIGALVIVISMLFAIGLAHSGDVFSISNTGGWAIALQAFLLLTAVAVALIGPGKFAVNRR
jgi:putative oxidoreductase